ncbi:MAG: phosphoenolpyruvate carboxykinase (ATP) [Bdellovibrionales bacterium]|nr:phosphoenolpyruvate carboxykinase (ATP) [Bdellovibrionales bacterium]
MQKIKLIEDSVRKNLAQFSSEGALVVETGKYTGRATKERFVVQHPSLEKTIDWGTVNMPLGEELAKDFFGKLQSKLSQGTTYTYKGYVGAFPIEVHSTSPWHIAFAANMFRTKPVASLLKAVPQNAVIRIYHDPSSTVSSLGLKHTTDTLILLDPTELKVGIVGTAYAGEIKKSAFTLCNYALPEHGILSMHSSANCLEDGSNSCVLFGLSGTGKTTLSASADRYLIGDDEIVWSPTGLSNLEGGCYAKLIDLKAANEPEIWSAVNRFGSIMENVVMDADTRTVDFTNRTRTENTRGSYPLTALRKVFAQDREAEAPRTIVFLTSDAFGAMPAVARLSPEQAEYHFISGYTAKVAGTEIGIKEPQAAFSHCFGSPFMPRHASVYARLLSQFAQKHRASIWLLNTGWTGGGYGTGKRFPIDVSRKLLTAIQSGALEKESATKHPVFGFEVPSKCTGVDAKFLEVPSGTPVTGLADRFRKNMERFSATLDAKVLSRGGPTL